MLFTPRIVLNVNVDIDSIYLSFTRKKLSEDTKIDP